jgi:hypothetical protein
MTTRPFSELTKDFTPERRERIKQQSKKLAEHLATLDPIMNDDELEDCLTASYEQGEMTLKLTELEDKVTYRSAITGICVYRKDQLRTLQTEVKLVDEGGGEYISIMDDQGQEIRLEFEEFDEVVKAVALLKNQ